MLLTPLVPVAMMVIFCKMEVVYVNIITFILKNVSVVAHAAN